MKKTVLSWYLATQLAKLISYIRLAKSVVLNHRDASRYWDLEALLLGLELFLKLIIVLNVS